MQETKKRQLHVLFRIEEQLLTKGAADRNEVLTALNESTPIDKLRLYLVYFIITYVSCGCRNMPMTKYLLLYIVLFCFLR